MTEGMILEFAGYTIVFILMYSVFKYYISMISNLVQLYIYTH